MFKWIKGLFNKQTKEVIRMTTAQRNNKAKQMLESGNNIFKK